MLNAMIEALASTNDKYYFFWDVQNASIVKSTETIDDMDVLFLTRTYPERFIPLPDKRQIHTYGIMEAFAEDAQLTARERDALHAALQGSGPFKRFRDTARKLGLEEAWLQFRDDTFAQIARDWCAQNGIDIDALEAEDAPTPVQSPTPPSTVASPHAQASADPGLLAIGLIESIRMLHRTLDDASFEDALDHLRDTFGPYI
ncbi:MAG: hypothetical protein IJ234_02880 [Clostridia bacterium]|nr:hypothetical protein [Clostridia bacterium]